ncbi:MAG: NADH-quinone oxidoreductase subunit L [Syntrophobacteraceae bacterium]
MQELVAFLVVMPLLSATLCLFTGRAATVRSWIVVITGCTLILCSVLLAAHVPFSYSPRMLFGSSLHAFIQGPDFVLMSAILAFAVRARSRAAIFLSSLQILLVVWLEVFQIKGQTAAQSVYCDHLALTLVLIISIVGAIICFQAIPYMKHHEEHLKLTKSRQPGFFFVMLAFLGIMNGMALSNDLTVFHFFFECTTLCSFLLIGHDATPTATRNAVRALWMNTLGCVAFVVAMILIDLKLGTLDLQAIIHLRPGAGLPLIGLALLCLAGFVKSAQFPFQSWLLGAMVAPTPVSALLHSSTMVKIGVYLAIRLAPAMQGTFLSQCVALFGAVSFVAGAALAVGQSNGKKVLAYSTISNLGLIFACAGLGTAEALTAGTLLIVFHALVKALLFLSVGAIEQVIESRDIEDMRGLYARMPVTALITVMGVIMMIMPPFGLVLGKWMALEAAAATLPVILLLAFGSALTVLYWARWAGALMSDPFAGRFRRESQPVLTWIALMGLSAGAGGLSVAAPWVYRWLFVLPGKAGGPPAYWSGSGGLENSVGVFAVVPLSVVAILAFCHAMWALGRARAARVVAPYLSGIQTAEPQVFVGPMGRPVKAEARSYYLSSLFGESRLTGWIDLVAGLLLILMLGSTL